MSGRRSTRPWGPLYGATPQDDAVAMLMRGWMDEAGLTLKELQGALGQVSRGPLLSQTAVGVRLAGRYLTGDFIDAVAFACFPDETDAKQQAGRARAVLDGSEKTDTDQMEAGRAFRGRPLSLARLQQRVDHLRDGRSDDNVPPFTQLQRENSQLRLNVAELGNRVHAMTKEREVLTSERDQLRRRCAAITRELAAAQAEMRKLTERLGQQPDVPSSPHQSPPMETSVRSGEGQPPTEELPPRPAGGPSGPRSPGSTRSSAGGSRGPDGPGVQATSGRSTERVSVADPAGDPASATHTVPLDFQAFYATNLDPYLKYALSRLRDWELAQQAVEDAFVTMLDHWEKLVLEPQLAASAWAILREKVSSHDSASLAQTLEGMRIQLASMDEAVGLYSAISTLPPREYDVVVLRYVAERSTAEIGRLLDISPSTVDYYLRQARHRLAKILDLQAWNEERHP